MKFDESLKYLKQATKNKFAVDLIKYVSIETWNRIGFVKNLKKKENKIYEVALTQNIIFEILKFCYTNNNKIIEIYESNEESTNGSDILLNINIKEKHFTIPIQAKIIDISSRNGNYNELNHSNSNGSQIDLLEKFAVDECSSKLALYLFYNYKKDLNILNGEKNIYYGCSIISTKKVRELKTQNTKINFVNVHPDYATPFYKLFVKDDDSDNGGSNPKNDKPSDPVSPNELIIDALKKIFDKIKFEVEDDFFDEIKTLEKKDIVTSKWILKTIPKLTEDLIDIKSETETVLLDEEEENDDTSEELKTTSEDEIEFRPRYMIIYNTEENLESKLKEEIKIKTPGEKKELTNNSIDKHYEKEEEFA